MPRRLSCKLSRGFCLTMSRSHRPIWQRYGVALIISAAALALKLLLLPLVTHDEPAALFFAAVMISAVFGGLGPGLLATAIGALCDEYFFMAPYRTWHLNSPDEAFRLGVFVAEGDLHQPDLCLDEIGQASGRIGPQTSGRARR